jgi:tRNA threonylcarbamoyladenosine modification (KEOPS) complex  Pcc1 subunit
VAPPLPTGQIAPVTSLPVSVPFEVWNGMIVVRATVGEGVAQRAALHISLPLCLMTPQLAAQQRIASEGVGSLEGIYGTVRLAGIRPQMLRIQNIVLTDVPMGVLDLYAHLSSKAAPDAPAVWIGNSALAAFVLTIDPQKQEIIFSSPTTPLPRRAAVVPFEIRDGRIWIEAKANDSKRFRAMLDTSAFLTLLPTGVGRDLQLLPSANLTTTYPDGKTGKVVMVTLSELAVGDAKSKQMQALFVEGEETGGMDPQMGIIGNDFLLRHRVTIHYGQRKIAFEKIAVPTTKLNSVHR